jgi:hypothetical protein
MIDASKLAWQVAEGTQGASSLSAYTRLAPRLSCSKWISRSRIELGE